MAGAGGSSENCGGWVVPEPALGFHVAKAACCCILAKSAEHPEKRMPAMQRALECRIFEHAFAAFDQVEQHLSAGVQVKALPAAGEAAKAATPKRKSGKAITAEFETLDASQAGDREVSNNGHSTFRRQQ
jgi:hypothetical protein